MPSVKTDSNPSTTPPSIISLAFDLPNICSLVGLFSALLALYFALIGIYPAAMIGLIWAVFFDWNDGKIARKMKNRTAKQGQVGGQVDSLIDLVSFGICPAVILLSYGNYDPIFFPGAFIIVAACVLRLSYFNVYGLDGKSTYQGLASDNNAIILVFVFLLERFISTSAFTIVLYITILVIAALNVASIRTPKLSGSWYYVLALYTLFITVAYGWLLV
ncbi:CDP-alcohol phosphatidyltransferase [Colwellia sp. MT41]|uniref:CDP-diacylglycerol--serine O-phosphatidyltransferase n=1 Tax=Colwellia marinimaniae TaxID=1513592 RepID=A0ABQ0MXR4_9GAMM|nr:MULTISPECIES: CDP-alcohol phosphatidyltransferase family protein [Colwellia]ALO33830.1 CDP-alcohol phosphatidyltransferase [Colwellia sp. MT41]GAW97156.1 CDP-diacylglycerol--serine O-phosphatidyltransferase [Colwellia marinimaniae]